MKKIFLLWCILVLGNVCFSVEEIRYDKKVSFVHEIFNFHVVSPNVMRGSQPPERGFKLLKKYCRVRTVLRLRDNKQSNG